jgi:hydroxymethylpyrimidine pyrophosphatase-like HAD family hydrolase
MKTLYITDLDGTLLKGDQTLSDYTAEALNQILKKGIL